MIWHYRALICHTAIVRRAAYARPRRTPLVAFDVA
jgi:hypothetical protein